MDCGRWICEFRIDDVEENGRWRSMESVFVFEKDVDRVFYCGKLGLGAGEERELAKSDTQYAVLKYRKV